MWLSWRAEELPSVISQEKKMTIQIDCDISANRAGNCRIIWASQTQLKLNNKKTQEKYPTSTKFWSGERDVTCDQLGLISDNVKNSETENCLNPGLTYLDWIWSYGWKESFEGVLVVTRVSTSWAEVISRIKWRLGTQTNAVILRRTVISFEGAQGGKEI